MLKSKQRPASHHHPAPRPVLPALWQRHLAQECRPCWGSGLRPASRLIHSTSLHPCCRGRQSPSTPHHQSSPQPPLLGLPHHHLALGCRPWQRGSEHPASQLKHSTSLHPHCRGKQSPSTSDDYTHRLPLLGPSRHHLAQGGRPYRSRSERPASQLKHSTSLHPRCRGRQSPGTPKHSHH